MDGAGQGTWVVSNPWPGSIRFWVAKSPLMNDTSPHWQCATFLGGTIGEQRHWHFDGYC